MPKELWMEAHNIISEAVTKTIPKKKEMQDGRVVVRGDYKQLRKEEKLKTREKGKNITN